MRMFLAILVGSFLIADNSLAQCGGSGRVGFFGRFRAARAERMAAYQHQGYSRQSYGCGGETQQSGCGGEASYEMHVQAAPVVVREQVVTTTTRASHSCICGSNCTCVNCDCPPAAVAVVNEHLPADDVYAARSPSVMVYRQQPVRYVQPARQMVCVGGQCFYQ